MTTASGSTTRTQEVARLYRYQGPIAPIAASILIAMAWCVFIVVYALFWSKGFDVFQNLIVTVVSLITTGLAIGLMWVLLVPRNIPRAV